MRAIHGCGFLSGDVMGNSGEKDKEIQALCRKKRGIIHRSHPLTTRICHVAGTGAGARLERAVVYCYAFSTVSIVYWETIVVDSWSYHLGVCGPDPTVLPGLLVSQQGSLLAERLR